MIGTLEDVPADKRTAKLEKCFVNVSATIEASAQTTKAVEPGVHTFDDPAKFAETTTVLGAALRYQRFDAAVAQFLAVWLGVVAPVEQPSQRIFELAS